MQDAAGLAAARVGVPADLARVGTSCHRAPRARRDTVPSSPPSGNSECGARTPSPGLTFRRWGASGRWGASHCGIFPVNSPWEMNPRGGAAWLWLELAAAHSASTGATNESFPTSSGCPSAAQWPPGTPSSSSAVALALTPSLPQTHTDIYIKLLIFLSF